MPHNAELQRLIDDLWLEISPRRGEGKVATYIPALANVNPMQFGIAAVTLDGSEYMVGDASQPFSIQSISKVFSFALAYSIEGEPLWQRVGREPSGNAFNSLVQLENEAGKPRNPLINAGALVIDDLLSTRFVQPELAVTQFLRRVSACPQIDWSETIAESEWQTGDRNRAMAYFIKSFGNFKNDPRAVVKSYCRQCAIMMSCRELSRAALFLANSGIEPWKRSTILEPAAARRTNAIMMTCGTYDAAGDVAYRVGLPVKSGVGGGVLAVIPGWGAITVWGPGLDQQGNSVLGVATLERFVALTQLSVFDTREVQIVGGSSY